MATSRTALLTALGRETSWLAASGTASSGTTTTLVDTGNFQLHSRLPDQFLRDCWLYVNAGTNAAVDRLITAYTAASKTATVDAAGSAYDNTSVYEIWRGISRTELNRCLTTLLTQRLQYRTLTPLTLATDGDMETSGVTNWTAGGGSALAKVTSSGNVEFGSQALQISNSGINGYAQSASINVNGNETFHVEALARSGSGGTVSLIPYDVTNSAAITVDTSTSTISSTNTPGGDWHRLYATFQVPQTCRSLAFRLQSSGTSDVHIWDDLIVNHRNRVNLPLPSWMTGEDQFEWAWRRSGNRVDEWTFDPCTETWVDFDLTAVRGGLIQLPVEYRGKPCYVSGFRYYSDYATDAGTTDSNATVAPQEWLTAGLAVEGLKRMWSGRAYQDLSRQEKEIKQRWEQRLQAAERKLRPKRKFMPFRLGTRGA